MPAFPRPEVRDVQESRLVDQIAPLLAVTRNDPELFLRLACNAPPFRKWQHEACEAIKAELARGTRRIRLLVRSCHGAGKTFLAAGLAYWWTLRTAETRGVTTAPTWTGVESLLWPEIRRLHRDGVFGQAGLGRCLTTQLILAPEHFTIGLSTDNPPNLEGHHSRTSAVRVVDEAKAVPGGIFDSTEGLLDAPEILDVWISTPSVAYGHFYDRDIAQAREDDGIIRLVVTIDDLIADGVPGKAEWKADRLLWWGEDSDEYQSRALARYLTDSERNLFPPTWVEKAMAIGRDVIEGKTFGGLDVAGSVDGDENAIVKGRGFDSDGFLQVTGIEAWKEPNTMKTRERALRFLNEESGERRGMAIDTVGIGKGLYDSLVEKSHEVISFVAQASANDPTRYVNRKAELAFFVRELLEHEKLILPPKAVRIVERLKTQMAGMRFRVTTTGKKQLIDPDDSPDLVDALLIFVHAALVGLGRGIIPSVGAVKPKPSSPSAGMRRTKVAAA